MTASDAKSAAGSIRSLMEYRTKTCDEPTEIGDWK